MAAAQGEEKAAASTPPEASDEARVMTEAQRLVATFHAAARSGDVEGIHGMVQASPAPLLLLNARDAGQGGVAAVHVAARAGHESALAALLDHGACPWLPDGTGLTALDYARVRNRKGCLALLQERVKADPPGAKEVSPLVASFFEAPCDNAWMEWALDHYGVRTLLDTRGRDQSSPLHFAMTNNDPALVASLLDMGADPFVRDQEGRSPLDIAARSGNPAMVQAVSSAMRTQLIAFACLAGLFLLYRQGGDGQQAWRLLALGWPTVKTLHTLLALVPSATTPARRQHLMGEWLCYWAAIGPIFLLEHLALDTPWGQRGMKLLLAVLESSGGEGFSASGLRTLGDIYIMAKIVFTLYLIYPACRGARVLYQMHVDPEERARRRARAERERKRGNSGTTEEAAVAAGQGQGQDDKRKAD